MFKFGSIYSIFLFLSLHQFLFSQIDTVSVKSVTIHFLHGSKPAKGYEQNESKWFGGIHGGHVYIQIDSFLISFYPKGDFHVFSHKNDRHSIYHREEYSNWSQDTTEMQYTSIKIPVTDDNYIAIRIITEDYLYQSPYDYAFFGMRCAAAANDVLANAGLTKNRSHIGHAFFNFYPKLLRKRLTRNASTKGYSVHIKAGRKTREWEK